MVQLPPPPSPPARDRLLGTLVVIVLRAKNLPNKARIGKQNPYCTVQYGLHKKRTATIERGGQQPEWDAEFRFEILKAGLGGEEQLAGEGALVTHKGGVLPAPPSGADAAAGGSKLEKRPPGGSLVVAPLATGYPPGKRVLRIACWADDARDPKLIGEGELDFDGTIKTGKFDDWVKLERKGRYAGEVYLELTWYSNEPRPAQSPRKASLAGAGPHAYGGAGSRVEDQSESDDGTEEWDGGSQVGLSAPGHQPTRASFSSAPGPPTELSADYPDADLAPLTTSFSSLSVGAGGRPPLPQPPLARPTSAAYAPTSDPYAAYQPGATPNPYEHDRRASYPASSVSGAYSTSAYATPPPPPMAQGYGYGAYGAGEFGQYAAAPPPPPQQQHQQGMGEFERLAHEHYASQSYPHASTSAPYPPEPHYAPTPAPPPPPPQHSYHSYSSASPYPSTSSYPAPPPSLSHTPYAPSLPQPPVPPIPPSSSGYWTSQPPPPQLTHSGSYPSLPHSGSQATLYAAPPPPPSIAPSAFSPPPAAPAHSAFSPPPPPPSLSGFAPPPPPPQHPYPQQTVFSPPPPPPSLRGELPAPPVPPIPPQGYGAPAPPTHPSYAPVAGRPPLPLPPATPAGGRPLPGTFAGRR
ncbi:hypothetical protein JCM10450v2_005594 [Rhodotorula kratochvilovae]